MSGFLYGLGLQWKLDLRNKEILILYYIVPLLFFAVMGGIFSSINPLAGDSLIQSMTVFGASMGAFIGLPSQVGTLYGSDIKKVYKANGVPLYLGVVTLFLSAFVHLMITSTIIFIVAPMVFDAAIPVNVPLYYASLAVFLAVSLSLGTVLGLLVKGTSKLSMAGQMVFLPSTMLSGIMFPTDLLPQVIAYVGRILPATWGYQMMTHATFDMGAFIPLAVMLLVFLLLCGYGLHRAAKE